MCEANLHTILWEFLSINCTDYHTSFCKGISSLTNDLSVSYRNYHPVFRCVVLTFILDHQVFWGIVISFTLSLSSEFHLVSLEVGLIFDKPCPAEERPMSAARQRPAGLAQLRGWRGAGVLILKCMLPLRKILVDVGISTSWSEEGEGDKEQLKSLAESVSLSWCLLSSTIEYTCWKMP